MKTVAYCRYSTDLQSATSIADQARVCRARAEALGLRVDDIYADEQVSGATPILARPSGMRLHSEALAGRIAVILIESLDRLSRDLVEQETVVRRLEHRGVRLIAVDGYDSNDGELRALTRGVKGLMSEHFLHDLRRKTHRGLVGQLERGFHAGGLSFGYRSVVAGRDARGEPIGHRLEVDKDRAAIVRRIFDEFGSGLSCQRIAAMLNSEGVPGPRGTWSVSALFGSPAKGSGVLNNDLYRGVYVWNRSRWVKDPDTGRRQRFDRPAAEWHQIERPDLRIVTPAQWDAVRRRMDARREAWREGPTNSPPRTLFGGLMRCGRCGGPMIAVSAHAYGCANRKDRGPSVCSGIYAPRRATDVRLLGYVRAALNPNEIAAAAGEIVRQRRAQAADIRKQQERRRAALAAEIRRLVDAIATVGVSPALSARLQATERELATVAAAPTADATSPPTIESAVRRALLNLHERLAADTERARAALREALDSVVIEAEGDAVFASVTVTADRLVLSAGGDASLVVVAGEGFEPSTFGL